MGPVEVQQNLTIEPTCGTSHGTSAMITLIKRVISPTIIVISLTIMAISPTIMAIPFNKSHLSSIYSVCTLWYELCLSYELFSLTHWPSSMLIIQRANILPRCPNHNNITHCPHCKHYRVKWRIRTRVHPKVDRSDKVVI